MCFPHIIFHCGYLMASLFSHAVCLCVRMCMHVCVYVSLHKLTSIYVQHDTTMHYQKCTMWDKACLFNTFLPVLYHPPNIWENCCTQITLMVVHSHYSYIHTWLLLKSHCEVENKGVFLKINCFSQLESLPRYVFLPSPNVFYLLGLDLH